MGAALLAVGIALAPAAEAKAVATSATTTGAYAGITVTFTGANSATVNALAVADTVCDARYAAGRAIYKDAYGNRHYLTERRNGSGCGTTANWSSYITSSGDHEDSIFYVGIETWRKDGPHVVSTVWLDNPYV